MKMSLLFDEIWKLTSMGATLMCEEDPDIKFDSTKEDIFNEWCDNLYNKVLTYMKEPDKPLDRHKVAAIIMISIIKSNILTSSRNSIFMGNYILAVETGLSYLMSEINIKLKEKNIQLLKEFEFPDAFSCPTDYIKIFYRNLYFANTEEEWGLNPLDIAEKLFLIEYITLYKNKINLSLLKEF